MDPTFGGGGGAGVPTILSSSHTPRSTGEVFAPLAVTFRMLACVSNPPRTLSAGKVMRRRPAPFTGGNS